MLKYTIAHEGIVLESLRVLGTPLGQVALGIGPIIKEGDTYEARGSTLNQGDTEILSEKAVTHSKSEGYFNFLPRSHFINVSGDSYARPCLAYKPTPTSTPIIIGNYTVQDGGELFFRAEGFSDKEPLVGYCFVKFDGYVATVGMSAAEIRHGVRYYHWDLRSFWFNADYSAYTQRRIERAPVETVSDIKGLAKHLWEQTSVPNKKGAVWIRSYYFKGSRQRIPDWLRYTAQHSGPFWDILPRKGLKDPWGELAQRAVSSLDSLDINGLAYVSEAINWRQLLPPVKDFKKLSNPKSWANIYLWLRYGLSLSYRDTMKVIKALPRLLTGARDLKGKKQRLRARTTQSINDGHRTWTRTLALRVVCDTYPSSLRKIGQTIDNLYSLDVMPTLGNIWDLIPMSFVVDWFIPVSEVLENIDTRGRLQSFSIHVVTRSEKWKSERPTSISIPGFVTQSRVVDTFYKRRVGTTLPLRGVLDTTPSGPAGIRRFFDATALTVQRTR